jgi:hypothetical protein
MTENEKRLKDMILSIKQQRSDLKTEKNELKEREKGLKELEDEFLSLCLVTFGERI